MARFVHWPRRRRAWRLLFALLTLMVWVRGLLGVPLRTHCARTRICPVVVNWVQGWRSPLWQPPLWPPTVRSAFKGHRNAKRPCAAGSDRPTDRCFDVVITWKNNTSTPAADTEMLYLLRSLERYEMDQHLRLVHIVAQGLTDASLPWYLNRSSPTLRLHRHADIFRNRSTLPTESRNAIQANFVNIPELASTFLYIQDDSLLVAPFRVDTLIRDLYVDTPSLAVEYDDRFIANLDVPVVDVPVEATMRVPQLVQYTAGNTRHVGRSDCEERPPGSEFVGSVECSALVLNRTFGSVRSGYFVHCPQIASLKLMREAYAAWPEEWARTTSNKWESGLDLQWHTFMSGLTLATTTAVEVPASHFGTPKPFPSDFDFTTIANPDSLAFCQEFHTNSLNDATPAHQCLPDDNGELHPSVALLMVELETMLENKKGTQWLNLQGPGISIEYSKCPPVTKLVYGWLHRTYPNPSKWEKQPLPYPLGPPIWPIACNDCFCGASYLEAVHQCHPCPSATDSECMTLGRPHHHRCFGGIKCEEGEDSNTTWFGLSLRNKS